VPPPARAVGPGDEAGEFIFGERLGAGGQAVVYAGRNRVTGQPVALKVLRSDLCGDPDMVRRFVREAAVLGRLQHPNVVRLLDLGTLPDGRLFLATELAQGMTLQEWLGKRGRVSPLEVLSVLEPLCAALEAAHRLEIVHRDIKASNIIVGDAEHWELKLLDFGIAKVLQGEQGGPALTVRGQRVGTGSAMAPEQILGTAVDPRTDIYALGILLFQLVTGRLPFSATSPLLLEQLHLESPPPRASRLGPVPPALDAVISRCLAKPKEDRYPDVVSFLAAVRCAVTPT